MGTKPRATVFKPTLQVFTAFWHSENKTLQARKVGLEKAVDDTLQDYPWYTNHQLVGDGKGCWRFQAIEPLPLKWVRGDYYDHDGQPSEIRFPLILAAWHGIKESQLTSILRYGEMLGKIISARSPEVSQLSVHASLEVTAYESLFRFAEPGDIVWRKSQPGKYFYFGFHHTIRDGSGPQMCHLTSIEQIGRPPDCITTHWDEDMFIPVDHLPQLTAEESVCLVYGKEIGTREPLIAKWRPKQVDKTTTANASVANMRISPPVS